MAALAFPDYDACLVRLGFNQATVDYFRSEDLGSPEALKSIGLSSMDRLYKNLNKPENFPVAAAGVRRVGGGVKISYLNWIKVMGLRAWIDFRSARGQPLDLNEFNGDELVQKWSERATEVIAFNLSNRPEGTLPPVLRTDWRSFEELFRTFLLHRRSTYCGTPLAYVIRETAVPTAEVLAQEFATIDECLVATHSHTHTSFDNDNHEVFDFFKRLIYQSTSWTFALRFDEARDGRGAFLAVKSQAEGQSATITQRAAAYRMISDARFTGVGTRYTFDDYIAAHQKGHNELERLNEPVPETKKVTDFLAGISEKNLETAITFVRGSLEHLGSFERCQQYLKTVNLNTKRTTPKSNVSAVTTNNNSSNNGPPGKRGRGNNNNNNNNRGGKKAKTTKRDPNIKKNLPRIRTGHYSDEEWKKMSERDRGLVLELRDKAKQANAIAASVTTEAPAAGAAANNNANVTIASVVTTPATEPEIRDALSRASLSPPGSPVPPAAIGNPRRSDRPDWFDVVQKKPPATASPTVVLGSNNPPAVITATVAAVATTAPTIENATPAPSNVARGVARRVDPKIQIAPPVSDLSTEDGTTVSITFQRRGPTRGTMV